MQIEIKSLTSNNTPKSSRAVATPELGPWPQPEEVKFNSLIASLADSAARRHALAYGRGIPYSPLND
jgi:hypothetical protein